LEEILKEEKAANETLTELARASSNTEALGHIDKSESNGHKFDNLRRNVRPGSMNRTRVGSSMAR